MRPTGAKWYRGMGHMANKAHRGYGVQGVWGTWAIEHNDTFNLNHLSPHRAIFPESELYKNRKLLVHINQE